MAIEDAFEYDAENSAIALAAGWQAEQFERIVAIRKEIARLEAEEVRVLAGLLFEAEGEAAEGAVDVAEPAEETRRHDLAVRSIATEFAASTRTSLTSAQAKLGEAWVLVNQLPATLAALEAGDQSRPHAHELVAETEHLGASRFAAEQALLPLAKTLPVAQFRRRAKRVLETLEKESVRARHESAFARRRVELTPARDGMAHLDAYLDASDAALLKTGLTNAAAEARALGDSRSPAQLQADLLVELLCEGSVTIGAAPLVAETDASTTGTLISRAPVSVEVLIPAEILAGDNGATARRRNRNGTGERARRAKAHRVPPAEIAGVGVIDPVRARQLVARAPSLRRVLTDPVTSAIVDFDRKTYRVPAELKRVIQRRDGHCRAPGCSLPVSATEIDHSEAYAWGGTTSLWNLACLCDNHHHLKHEAGWGLKQYLGGVLEWRAPSGRTYVTHPEAAVHGPPGQPVDPWSPPHRGDPSPAPFDLPDDDAPPGEEALTDKRDQGDDDDRAGGGDSAHAG